MMNDTRKLSDCITVIGGGTPKTSVAEYWGGNIPWLSVKDFNDEYRYVFTTEKTITELGLKNSATKLLQKDDIVISARGTVGELAMIPFPMAFNQSCYGIRAKEGINKTFLYYLIKNSILKLKSITHGTVFDTITRETFESIEVEIPDLKTQERIAYILSSFDDKVILNRNMIDNLFNQMNLIINDFLCNIKSYEFKTLSEIADCQNGYAFYKEGYDKDGAFVIDLGNVNIYSAFVKTNADKYISLDRYNTKRMEKFRVYRNDLVMVMTDRKSTMELLGKTGKIFRDGQYILNQRMYRIRPKNGINVNYLYACINSKESLDYLKSKALGSVQKYVNTDAILSIKIKVPSSSDMELLSNMIDPIMEKIEECIFENERLFEMRDILRQRIFNHSVDISETGE